METANSAIGHITRHRNQADHPRMWIPQRLHHLRYLEMLVLNTGLVLPEPLDSEDLLVVGEARAHRVIWQEQHDTNADTDRYETEHQEHDLQLSHQYLVQRFMNGRVFKDCGPGDGDSNGPASSQTCHPRNVEIRNWLEHL